MRVSYKKALEIIRGDFGIHDRLWVWKELQQTATNEGQVLLRTGAKLYKRGKAYHVHGYAHDGSDVLPYLDDQS